MGISDILIDNFDELIRLIPQKPPMVMIDKLISSEELMTTTAFTITESNVFCENGFFTEPGIIENMAQTVSIKSGYEAQSKRLSPSVGFIGEIKKLKIYFLPAVNQTLNTSVSIEHQVLNALIINGNVRVEDQLVAECKMKIFFNINY